MQRRGFHLSFSLLFSFPVLVGFAVVAGYSAEIKKGMFIFRVLLLAVYEFNIGMSRILLVWLVSFELMMRRWTFRFECDWCRSVQKSSKMTIIPKAGSASSFALSCEDMIPNDLVGLGVAVAVKKPVRI